MAQRKAKPAVNAMPVTAMPAVDAIRGIEEALRAVKCATNAGAGIPYSHTIDAAARHIFHIYLQSRVPRRPKPSVLHNQFRKKVEGLRDFIYGLPREIAADIFETADAEKLFHAKLTNALIRSLSAHRRKAGAHADTNARSVAIAVANHYYHLSGREPGFTRSPGSADCTGEYYILLSQIFNILNIDANVRTTTEFVRENREEIDKAPGFPGSVRSVDAIVHAKRRKPRNGRGKKADSADLRR